MSPVAEVLSATTASRVADDLRRRILVGELRPGQRLKIDELALLCGVSHMPIREALRELEGEGVLDVFPHRGAVIRGVDADFIGNFYDVRGALEGLLAEKCAERAGAATIQSLQAAAAAFERASKRDTGALLAANRRFHDIVNAGAGNPGAVRMLAHGRVLADALRARFGYGIGRLDTIIAEHRALLRALEKRDAAQAGEVARRHCLRARDDLLRTFKETARSG